MSHSSLYPSFAIIRYEHDNLVHKMTLPVVIDTGGWTIGQEPNVVRHNLGEVPFSTAVVELTDLLLPLFFTDTEFLDAEIWAYETEESDPVWVYSFAIGEPGTGGGATQKMNQAVYSFRTTNGGLFKLFLMETYTTLSINLRQPISTLAGDNLAIATYIVGATSWVWARDNGKPISPLWFTSKINDALRKRRLSL